VTIKVATIRRKSTQELVGRRRRACRRSPRTLTLQGDCGPAGLRLNRSSPVQRTAGPLETAPTAGIAGVDAHTEWHTDSDRK